MEPVEKFIYYPLEPRPIDPDSPYGRWEITDDSQISGGILPGRGGSESLVVDVDKHRELYEACLEEVVARTEELQFFESPNEKLLQAVFDVVQENIGYDPAHIKDLVSEAKDNPGNIIGLSAFVEERVGVCRHSALLAGTLTEALIGRGYLEGRVSFKMNGRVRVDDPDDHRSHAYLEVKTADGEKYILDPGMDFFGRESDAEKYGSWRY